jgi:hypothetical protein
LNKKFSFAAVMLAVVTLVTANASPAFAITTLPRDVVVSGGTNTVPFTSTFEGSDAATTRISVTFRDVAFTSPTTATALTLNSTTFTECGSTGISLKYEGGALSGTCETTVVSGRDKFQFELDTAQVQSGALLIQFGIGSVSFIPADSWGASLSLQFSDLSSLNNTELLTLQPAGASGATITFDPNGGSGSMPAQQATGPTAIAANTFTHSGYDFIGWNSDAAGKGVAYDEGDVYDFSADTTLFAQWGRGGKLAATGFSASENLSFLGISLLAGFVGLTMVRIASRRRAARK